MSRYDTYSPPRAPERWDRDRFESFSRGPPPRAADRYDEADYYASPHHREYSSDRRPQYDERDVLYYEERDRFSPPTQSRGPTRYWEEPRETSSQAMVPIREQERDRGFEIDIRTRERIQSPESSHGRPRRPQFIRRQSSLDTFDRKPMPRYGDRVHEEVIAIPTGPRRRSPPRYHDHFEEIRVADPDRYGDEEFRGYREREISRVRRPEREEFIEEREHIIERDEFPKRGKTKMPIRLINRKAIIQLGYPFEEEAG